MRGNSSIRGLFVRGHGVPGADILCSHNILRAGVLGDTGYSGSEPARYSNGDLFYGHVHVRRVLRTAAHWQVERCVGASRRGAGGVSHGHGNFPGHWPSASHADYSGALYSARVCAVHGLAHYHHGHSTAGSYRWRRVLTPDMFYKKESQEKTLLQRPDFFLFPSPHVATMVLSGTRGP